MAETALLLYGLAEHEAKTVRETLADALSAEIDILSASGLEKKTVEEILSSPAQNIFSTNKTRFVMFLGFNDEQISMALNIFPLKENRPIFCTLTESNLTWTIDSLAKHLLEEHNEAHKTN